MSAISAGAMTRRWALHSLGFHRTRTVLTVVAVGLATALAMSTLGFQEGYERSLERDIKAMGYQVLVTGKGCPHEAATLILRGGSIPMYIQQEVYQEIVGQPEVADSTRFLMQAVPLPEAGAHQLHVGIDEAFLRLKPGVEFQQGGWFTSETADEVILGFNVAEYRRLALGDELQVQGRRCSVRGILDKLGSQDDGTIFLPLSTAQAIFEKRDRLTGVGLRLRDPGGAGPLIDRLYELPSIQVVRISQVQMAILNVLNGVRVLLTAFAVLSLFVALTGVFNVALLSASERTLEMGVLRAMGCSAGTLFRLAWSESLALSAGGACLGVVLTVLLRGVFESFVRSTLVFVPHGTIVALTPTILIGCAVAVVALCLVAGIVPAWRSARVSPMVSIRGAATWS